MRAVHTRWVSNVTVCYQQQPEGTNLALCLALCSFTLVGFVKHNHLGLVSNAKIWCVHEV